MAINGLTEIKRCIFLVNQKIGFSYLTIWKPSPQFFVWNELNFSCIRYRLNISDYFLELNWSFLIIRIHPTFQITSKKKNQWGDIRSFSWTFDVLTSGNYFSRNVDLKVNSQMVDLRRVACRPIMLEKIITKKPFILL